MSLFSHDDGKSEYEIRQEEYQERRRKEHQEKKDKYLEGLKELTVEERLEKIEEALFDLMYWK